MPSIATATLIADLIELALNTALRYNALQGQAQREGRQVNLDDLRKLQADLNRKQAELDVAIANMPSDPGGV